MTDANKSNDVIESFNGAPNGLSNDENISKETVHIEMENDGTDKVSLIKKPGFFKRLSGWERILSILCFIALIASLIVIFTSEIFSNYKSVARIAEIDEIENMQKICYSPNCINTASMLLNSINESVDPCNDFYQFACGNYIKNHEIKEDQTQLNVFYETDDLLKKQLKQLISEKPNDNDLKTFKLANIMYKGCMNKTLIEEIGLTHINDIIELVGGWPVVDGDKWKDSEWNWEQTIYKFSKIGFAIDSILSFDISVDMKNNTKRIIDIDQPSFGLSREYLIKGLDNNFVTGYYNLMVETAILFGADKEQAEKELKESLDLEIELANNSLPTEKRRNVTLIYNPMSIKELVEKYPYLDWIEYIRTLLPDDISVSLDEIVTVGVPTYFEKLEFILKNTTKRTISNYLIWRSINNNLSILNDKARKNLLEFARITTGQEKEQDRWKECVQITQDSLSISVSALYVRKYFQESSKANALAMVNEIRLEFHKVLKEVDWMDEVTRKLAINKMNKIEAHIGYPNELQDNNKLEEYYKNLEIDSNQYLESILNVNKFNQYYMFSKLRKPVNNSDWETHSQAAVVNAFYNGIENSIQFPAGILQGTFFNAERPNYMNYGAIGYVIGHEITHGFDDQGQQFDENGNLINWWQPETKKLFLDKAKCMINQFSNYTDKTTGLKLNGIRTQGEIVADSGGGKLAYSAYINWVKKNGKEPLLPGLNYTQNQLFWIASAQNWCSLYKIESLESLINTDVHPPAEFRVIGTLNNMKPFATDFKCPQGSPMNQEPKCNVW